MNLPPPKKNWESNEQNGSSESLRACLVLSYSLQLCDCSLPDSSDKNTGVGCHALQGIFPPRDWARVSGISCIVRQILLSLSHLGSPSKDFSDNSSQ